MGVNDDGQVYICSAHDGFGNWAAPLDVETGDDYIYRHCRDCDWFSIFYIPETDLSWQRTKRAAP